MKVSNLLFLFIIGLFVASCTDKDEQAPTITLTSPAEGLEVEVGGVFTLSGTVTDNEELATIAISDGNSTTNITTFDSNTSHNLNVDVTISDDSNPGELTITVTATDAEGNSTIETATVTIVDNACAPAASCIQAGKTTVVVLTPSNTPVDAAVEMVGEFNGWPSSLDNNYVLTKNGDNCYCIAVELADGVPFKFRRDGDWGKVEKDANGEEIENRTFTPTPDGVVTLTVERWADL